MQEAEVAQVAPVVHQAEVVNEENADDNMIDIIDMVGDDAVQQEAGVVGVEAGEDVAPQVPPAAQQEAPPAADPAVN